MFRNFSKKHLVDVGAEELLALELDLRDVARLRTLDGHRPAELDPRHRQDAAPEAGRKGDDVVLVQVEQRHRALAQVVNRNLKNKFFVTNLYNVQSKHRQRKIS